MDPAASVSAVFLCSSKVCLLLRREDLRGPGTVHLSWYPQLALDLNTRKHTYATPRTPLHASSRHAMSRHSLHFTSLHFTSLHFTLLHKKVGEHVVVNFMKWSLINTFSFPWTFRSKIMPREKECKLKKPKNGCLLFYPTIETDNAEEIEYFIIISYAVLRNHAEGTFLFFLCNVLNMVLCARVHVEEGSSSAFFASFES